MFGNYSKLETVRRIELQANVEHLKDRIRILTAQLEKLEDDLGYRVSSVEDAVQENEAITQRGIADLRAKVDLLAKEAGVSFILKGPTEEHWELEQPTQCAIREQRFMGAPTVSFTGLYNAEELAHVLETEEFFAAKRDKKKK